MTMLRILTIVTGWLVLYAALLMAARHGIG